MSLSVFAAVLTVCFVTGVIWYNEVSTQQYTVVVKLKENQDPFQALPQVVPMTTQITNVHALDKQEYELTVKTVQPRKRLLDLILRSSKVESAR